MEYKFDIFISYRRSPTVGVWVRDYFCPLLESRLDENAPRSMKVWCDKQIEDGTNWPEVLKQRIMDSAMLLMVCSADYFRRPWCVAEWHSFREREKLLGLFGGANPKGLTYPIRYADGSAYPSEFDNIQITKDFTRFNHTGGFFRDSPEYLEFDKLVQKVAVELVARLEDPELPQWQPDFPIVTPDPDRPVKLSRIRL